MFATGAADGAAVLAVQRADGVGVGARPSDLRSLVFKVLNGGVGLLLVKAAAGPNRRARAGASIWLRKRWAISPAAGSEPDGRLAPRSRHALGTVDQRRNPRGELHGWQQTQGKIANSAAENRAAGKTSARSDLGSASDGAGFRCLLYGTPAFGGCPVPGTPCQTPRIR